MKQFIVLLAVLPLLFLFVMQFTVEQRTYAVLQFVQQEVNGACEEARYAGGFTQEIQTDLRSELSAKLQQAGITVRAGDIVIEADEGPRYRINAFRNEKGRGMIAYRITVPLGNLLAGGKLLGIDRTAGTYTMSGSIASELLP